MGTDRERPIAPRRSRPGRRGAALPNHRLDRGGAFAMVRSMEAIIDVVLPVFAIIAAGWLCGRLGLLGDDASQALNGFVYFAALPALFFGAMARVPLGETFNLPFILDYMGAVIALAVLTWLIGRRFFPGMGGAPDKAALGLEGRAPPLQTQRQRAAGLGANWSGVRALAGRVDEMLLNRNFCARFPGATSAT